MITYMCVLSWREERKERETTASFLRQIYIGDFAWYAYIYDDVIGARDEGYPSVYMYIYGSYIYVERGVEKFASSGICARLQPDAWGARGERKKYI